MTDASQTPLVSTDKPRVALMGEFSAGKSTLANLLLEQSCSPVKVTATQLPPVWYCHGQNGATRLTSDGARLPMDFDDHFEEDHTDTQLIVARLQADILETIDLIDMPGTSDPNLAVQYWKSILPQVDLVLWCTPANQAWRQSEAALWEEVDARLQSRSLLLITRIDQIRSDTDRGRILRRVQQEAGAAFRAVLPVSLIEAKASPSNEDALERSGVAELIRCLIGTLEDLAPQERPDFVPAQNARSKSAAAGPAHARATTQAERIVPRRIVRRPVAGSTTSPRPPAS